MSKNKDLDQYRSDLTQNIVTEIFKILDKEKKELGIDFSEEVLLSVLASIISTSIHKVLNSKTKNLSDKEKELIISKLYLDAKTNIENAIGAGFSTAFSDFVGTEVDFYCEVKAVPEPVNKLLC